MENKHTPGPFIVSDERECDTCHFATVMSMHPEHRGVQIAILRGLKPYRDGEGLANAHLLAAAPDLLDALREFIEYARSMDAECLCGDLPDDSICMTCKAKAAISKAEGK